MGSAPVAGVGPSYWRTLMSDVPITPGQVAFEAYQKLGGQSGLLASTTIRKYERLLERRRQLWEGIAEAVIDMHLQRTCVRCGGTNDPCINGEHWHG